MWGLILRCILNFYNNVIPSGLLVLLYRLYGFNGNLCENTRIIYCLSEH